MTTLLFLLLLPTARAAAAPFVAPEQPTGRLAGVVTDAATRQPLPGANVLLEGTALGAAADADGRFVVEHVPAGTYRVRVSFVGYLPGHRADVVVNAGRTTQLNVGLSEGLLSDDVTVTASFFEAPREITTSLYAMGYEEIRRAAGGLGDVSRLIRSMPGVAIADDQRNDLVVRGGSPSEVLTLVDNVEVPTLNHFASQGTTGGPVSMLNTEFIADATFLAGGFPARYGGRLSAVLDVSLREGSRERYGADLEMGFAGAGLILEGPLTPNGSVMLSARRSFLDLIIRDFGLSAVPRYSNYQAKAVLQPSRSDRLWLVSLGGVDEINFRVDEDDLDDPSLIDIDFRGWRTVTGLNWQRLFGSRGFGTLGVSHAHLAYGSVVRDTELDDAVVFENQSVEAETTLKYDLAVRLASALDLQAGASAKRLGSDLAIRQPLGYPSPFLLDPGRVNPVELDRRTASAQLGAYAQLTRTFADRLDLSAGARVDHFGLIRASTLAPRASARYRLTPALSVGASYGVFYQAPSAVFVHADPLNAALKPMRAVHYTGGLTLIPRADVRLSAEAYWKAYRDYPVSVQFQTLSLANAGDAYGVAGLMMPLVSEGRGRSRGVELHAQKKLTGRTYGHLSYTHSRTEHAALDGVLRRGAFDMPHLLSATGGVRASRSVTISGRFTYASGRPHTPFLGGPSREQNRGIYDLERVNAARSPHYQRLDVRIDRRHQFRTWSMTSFFELQNVLDRANVLRYEWNPKTRQPIAWNQIARFPVGGVNVKL